MGAKKIMTSDVHDKSNERPYAMIIGASSMVGRYLLKRLAARGFSGLCLTRQKESTFCDIPSKFSWRIISKSEDLKLPASAILFSLVPITELPGFIRRTEGGNQVIALSTSSAVFNLGSPDPAERKLAKDVCRAEDEVRQICQGRGANWTIFRPTLIYDPGCDRNVSAIAAFVQRYGFFPIVWPGTGKRQPIHADDVAAAMVAALDLPGAWGKVFALPGSETLTYREMVRRICHSCGKRPLFIYLPLSLARIVFYIWRLLSGAKYSVASLERMNMDLVYDPGRTQKALGLQFRPFRPQFPKKGEV